jgi:hypothetical protein
MYSRIRDPVLFYPPDPGSGMEQWSDPDPGFVINHPGSATLIQWVNSHRFPDPQQWTQKSCFFLLIKRN